MLGGLFAGLGVLVNHEIMPEIKKRVEAIEARENEAKAAYDRQLAEEHARKAKEADRARFSTWK